MTSYPTEETPDNVNGLIQQKLDAWKESFAQDLAWGQRRTKAAQFVDFLRGLPNRYRSLKINFTLSPSGEDDYILEDPKSKDFLVQDENDSFVLSLLIPRVPQAPNESTHGSANRNTYFSKGEIDTIDIESSRSQVPGDIYALVLDPGKIGALALRRSKGWNLVLNPSQINQIEVIPELPDYLTEGEKRFVEGFYS